jgi:hypothetical protein
VSERAAALSGDPLSARLAAAGILNPGLAASIGNRALTRLLQRSEADAPPPPTPHLRELRTYQVEDPDLPRRAADPELARRARDWRVKNTAMDPDSFRLNVAVIKYERRGRIYYKVMANDPAKLHSETRAVGAIEKGDRQWRHTQILEVFTERHPCSHCGPDLQAVRARIKALRAARAQSVTDFTVHYAVPKWEPGATRALDLQKKYLGKAAVPVKPKPKGKGKTKKPVWKPAPTPAPKPVIRRPAATPAAAEPVPPSMAAVEVPAVVAKPAPAVEVPAVVAKPAPAVEVPAVVAKPAPAVEAPPAVKPALPKVATPKVNFRAGAQSVAGALLILLGGMWFSKRFTEPAIESLLRDQVKALEPYIEKTAKAEVERVLATGWASLDPRPPYYLYVIMDFPRTGVFEEGMFGYDWQTPTAGIHSIFASPELLPEGPWEHDAPWPRGWEGPFERVDVGFMIEHNLVTSRTPLDQLIGE